MEASAPCAPQQNAVSACTVWPFPSGMGNAVSTRFLYILLWGWVPGVAGELGKGGRCNFSGKVR